MSSTGERTRRRRTAAQWRVLIAEQATSGVGQREFCRQRGLATSSFRNWKRKLESGGPAASAPVGFVELAVPAAPARDDAWEVELDLGNGMTLRVRRR